MAAKNHTLEFTLNKFNPTQNGLTTVLGPLETQIMQVVWPRQQATAADVHHELQLSRQRENRDIAYTTVMTTMSRLYEKHILSRHKVGMSFVYTPAFDQAEFVNLVVKNVMDSLMDEFAEPVARYLIAYVAQNSSLRRELSRVLVAPVADPLS